MRSAKYCSSMTVMLALLAGGAVVADDVREGRKSKPWSFEAQLQLATTDNIFRDEESRGEVSDVFATGRFIAERRINLENGMRVTPFVDLRHVVYDDIKDADYTYGQAGVEWRFGVNRLELSYGRSPERLLFITDEDENVDYETSQLTFRGRRDLGSRVLIDLRIERSDDDYEPDFSGRTNQRMRYRGSLLFKVTEPFRIKIGYTYDDTEADLDNYSKRRNRYEAGLEGRLASRSDFLLRYRIRDTEYLGSDPMLSNFGREDDRDDLLLELKFRLTPVWSLRTSGYYVDATSSRPDRNFDATEFSLTSIWTF